MRFRAWCVISLLVIPALFLLSQEQSPQSPLADQNLPTAQAKKDDCSFAGTIVNSVTGAPIRKAEVHLIPGGLDEEKGHDEEERQVTTTTDAEGRFSFSGLKAGHYGLLALHAGYVSSIHENRNFSRAYTLTAGQEIKDVVVRLVPAGVVRGRVVDEDGDPVSEIEVEALSAGKAGVGRRFTLQAAGGGTTNDLGEFRIYGLPPGRYYIRASPANRFGGVPPQLSKTQETTYTATFYPSSTGRDTATVLYLHGGDDSALEIALQRINVHTVSGTFTNAKGLPVQFGMLVAMQNGEQVQSTPLRAGKFELHLPAGHYTLVGEAFAIGEETVGFGGGVGIGSSQRPSEARKRIEVPEGGLHNVDLSVGAEKTSTVQVTGHVRAEAGSTLPKTPNLFIQLALMGEDSSEMDDDVGLSNRANGASGGAFVKPDSTFEMKGVPSGTYRLAVGSTSSVMEDWYTKSVFDGSHDVSNTGVSVTDADLQLDVVLSPHGGFAEGTVKDKDSNPAADVNVVLVPDATKRRDLYHTASTDQNGHFLLRGVEPGSYSAYAFEDAGPELWFNAEAMKQYKDDGVAVTISAADKAHLELHLAKSVQDPGTQ